MGPYSSGDTLLYKSMMLSDVPNLFYIGSYFHAAYTQRVDLVAIWVCRVMTHMSDRGYRKCVVKKDPNVPLLEEELVPSSGYVQRARSMGNFPQQPALFTKWQQVPDPFFEGS